VTVTLVADFDPNGWFASNQFRPNIAGYYSINAQVWWEPGAINTDQTNIQIRKNGSSQVVIAQKPIENTGIGYFQSVNTILYLNGTTDSIELTAFTGNPTSQNIAGASTGTWLTASLIVGGGTNGTSGTRGTSGSSGTSGANGTSGTSGENGTNGSSGTSGESGLSGNDGANSGRWEFEATGGGQPNSGNFVVDGTFSSGVALTEVTSISIDNETINSIDYAEWLKIILISFNNNLPVFLQITEVGNNSIIGIYNVTGVTEYSAYFDIGVSCISGGGDLNTTQYTISYVINGVIGSNGINGTSGTSGTGTSGTSGVSMAAGGTSGQILAKVDNTDYNTEWIDAPSGSGMSGSGTVDVFTKFDTSNSVADTEYPVSENGTSGTLSFGANAGPVTYGQIGHQKATFGYGAGDAQTSQILLMNTITGGTQDLLYPDYPTNSEWIVVNGLMTIFAQIIVLNITNGEGGCYEARAAMRTDGTGWIVIGSPSVTIIAEDTSSMCTIDEISPDGSGQVRFSITNNLSDDLQVVAYVRYTETFVNL
jgi:hypothetical protein